MLTVDTIPLHKLSTANFRLLIARSKREIGNRQLPIGNSLGLFMIGVLTATATELTKLQPIRRSLLILGRNVIAALTLTALKHNIVAWHFIISNFRLPISNCFKLFAVFNRQSSIGNRQCRYSTTSETVPAPTVRPPSRIAKRSPFSMAIGAINSISIATLSPGITISTPAGSAATPVTSVVRK